MQFLCRGTYVYVKFTLRHALKAQKWNRDIVLMIRPSVLVHIFIDNQQMHQYDHFIVMLS
jgi:hypothetical protein